MMMDCCSSMWPPVSPCTSILEQDNPALKCIPLTQARIKTLMQYFGPADTCEASARDACSCLGSWCMRTR